MVTSAREWKGRIEVEGTELLLPSDNTALVRQISPTAFLQSGFMPDPLTAIVRQAINTKQGLPPKAMKDLSEDPEKIGAAMETFDRVLTFVVIEPIISMPPACDIEIKGETCGQYVNADVHKDPAKSGKHQYHEGKRNPDILYADQVDMADKMFIFQWALGGTRDIAKFREQQQQSVDNVSDGKAVRRTSKRTSGNPAKR
jgi:hypothetical protein